MFVYAIIWCALYALALALGAVGAHAVAMILFPIPVACYCVLGRVRAGVGLIACAGVVAAATLGTFAGVIEYGLTAGIGMLVGLVMLRRWPLGWGITLVTSGVYALVAGSMLANWQETQTVAAERLHEEMAKLEAGIQSEQVEKTIALLQFMEAQWENLAFGLLFTAVLMMVVVGMTFVAWRFRARGIALGPVGMFRNMRTPEWVVWVAIVVALMYFWEQKWPNEVLRAVTWNSAIALLLVYFLNGFSILIYAITVLTSQMYLFYIGLFFLFMLGMQPILTAVGLFDTWCNFRNLLDRANEARQLKQQSDDK